MLVVSTCKRNGSCHDVEEELCECFLQCIVTFSKCYSLLLNNVKGAVSQNLLQFSRYEMPPY